MNKKSQIFIFDLIFAFIILIVSLGLFYAYYLDVDENEQLYDLNMDILNGFTNTKINNLNDDGIRDLFIQNKIRNIENSVAEQVVEFYINNNTYPGEAESLTKIYVKDYVDKQMNFLLSIENKTGGDYLVLYKYPEDPMPFRVEYENASIATHSQRIIFSFRNQTEFYGPFVFKVKIWK